MKKGMFLIAALVALLAFGFGSQQAIAQGSVAGSVVDADGAGVAGAHVELMGMGGGHGQRPFRANAETDENGAFAFGEVPAGQYVASAGAREMGMAHARLEVADGQETEVVLELQGHGGGGGGEGEDPQFGSVSGTVVDADGNAVAEARITIVIRHEDDNGGRHRRHHVRHVRGVSDENGEFSFEEVPAGAGLITAGKREVGIARARIEVVVDENTEVELQLQGREDRGGDGEGGGGDGDDRRGRRGRWGHGGRGGEEG